MRIGIGYDIHRLVEGRRLIIGGVHIPFEKGLVGHSDGDVLIHAIIDALLGAAGLPDIGSQFPPDDPKYKDIDSKILLRLTMEKIKDFSIINIDATIIAEEPKLSPFIEEMKKNLSPILKTGNISIKAKTNEKIGEIGRGEAIASIAVALISHENI